MNARVKWEMGSEMGSATILYVSFFQLSVKSALTDS